MFKLYKDMASKYEVAFKFSQDELAHHLLPRDGVIMTLVVENDDEKGNRVLTDFISYYHLPSQILKCKEIQHEYKLLNVSKQLIFLIFNQIILFHRLPTCTIMPAPGIT